MGTKPCIVLQGPLFESNETLQRLGNLMIDFFKGTRAEMVRLQGLELVIALTALSEEQVLFRVYKSVAFIYKGDNPIAEQFWRKQMLQFFLELSLLKLDLKSTSNWTERNLPVTSFIKLQLRNQNWFRSIKFIFNKYNSYFLQKPKNKNVKFDAFGNKVAKVHTGRQQLDQIQTRKVKAFKGFKKQEE